MGANAATQPYYGAATSALGTGLAAGTGYNNVAAGLAGAGAQPVNPGQLDVGQYLSPYLQSVGQTQEALLNQQNQQQMSGELGNIIQQGAFGGDRAGIAAGSLEQQQDIANNSILSNILNTGYNTALGAAQQQQGVGLSAAQANRAAQQTASGQLQSIGQQQYAQDLGASQQAATLGQDIYGTGAATSSGLASLGSGAQAAALQGAQANLAAGQVQQQTSQAQDTAQYNQFLQQQSYPFQVDQFLANIAEGTGALSGSTTTTTQPGGLFSDERLKENIRRVGTLHDGQKVYSYNYKGDNVTHIGLLAHEVQKKHPEAVGLSGGYKTVEYGAATRDAARERRYRGGLVAANDRGGYADGGQPGYDPQMMEAILANREGMYGPYGSSVGGGSPASGGSPYGGSGRVPAANLPVAHLAVAGGLEPKRGGLDQATQIAKLGTDAAAVAKDPLTQKAINWTKGELGLGSGQSPDPTTDANFFSNVDQDVAGAAPSAAPANDDSLPLLRRGGRVRRYASGGLAGYAGGGMPYEDEVGGPTLDIPNDTPTQQLATAKGSPGGGSSASPLSQIGGLLKAGTGLAQAGEGIAGALGGAGGLAGEAGTAAGTAAGMGSSISSLLPLLAFFERGGRVGRASGGLAGRGSFADGGPSDDNSSDTGLNAVGQWIAGTAQGAAQGLEDGYDAVTGKPLPSGAAPVNGMRNAAATTTLPTGVLLGGLAGYGVDAAKTLVQGGSDILGGVLHDTPTSTATPPTVGTPLPANYRVPASGGAPATAAAPVVRRARRAGLSATPAPDPTADANFFSNVDKDVAGPGYPDGHPTLTNSGAGLAAANITPFAGIDAPQGDQSQADTSAAAKPSGLSAAGDVVSKLGHGAWDWVTDPTNNHQNLVSLLGGIAGMVNAPTSHFGNALASGVQSGIATNQAIQKQQADLRLTGAETYASQTGSTLRNLQVSRDLMGREAMGLLHKDPGGPYLDPATGMRYSTGPAPGGPGGAGGFKYSGDNIKAAIPQTQAQFVKDAPAYGVGQNPANITQSDGISANAQSAAEDAQTNLTNLNEQAAALFSPSRTGVLSQGALAPILAPYIAKWNSAMTAAGKPELALNGLGDVQIAQKLQTGSALAAATGAGEKSYAALQKVAELSPGAGLDPHAAAMLTAQLGVMETKNIDKRNVYQEVKNATGGRYEAQDIESAFDKDYTPATYDTMRDAAANLYENGGFSKLAPLIAQGPGSAGYSSAVQALDAYGAQRHIKNFSRMFVGG